MAPFVSNYMILVRKETYALNAYLSGWYRHVNYIIWLLLIDMFEAFEETENSHKSIFFSEKAEFPSIVLIF